MRTTAASLPPLNTGPVLDCCAENVDDASGRKGDVNELGSGCPIYWVVPLEAPEPSVIVEALLSLEASPV